MDFDGSSVGAVVRVGEMGEGCYRLKLPLLLAMYT